MAEISLDYLAGMVDADGCISINKRKANPTCRTINPTYSPSLSVSNTDQQLLFALQEQYGGHICKDNGVYAKWEIMSGGACELLESLVPKLRIKRRQASICIELQSGIIPGKSNSYDATAKEEEWERREALYLRIKELNSGSYGKKSNSQA